MIVKRIVPLSLAKICGVLYALGGLVAGGILSVVALAGGFGSDPHGGFMTMVGAGAVVILPIFYGCLGFVATLIGAWAYNLLAGIVGGIEFEAQ